MLILVLGHVSPDLTLVDHIPIYELNHLYTEQGVNRFSQAIFWEWNMEFKIHDIKDWRSLQTTPIHRPIYDFGRNIYYIIWMEHGRIRKVFTRSFYESWTLYDPEMEERNLLPENERTHLRKRK